MSKREQSKTAKPNKPDEAANDMAAARHWREIARQVLAEHGENPDYWIISATQNTAKGQLRFLCAAPPVNPVAYAGPLLEQALAANLSLATMLLMTEHVRDLSGIACASFGFVANKLADFTAAGDFGSKMNPADYPADFCEIIQLKRLPDPLSAIRTAIHTMLQLGYQRLARPFAALSNLPTAQPGANSKLTFGINRDGGLLLTAFPPDATFEQFYDTLTASAAKAKLLRLRQGAKNCGGCGRCCSDANIPLTYFDLRSVAKHRFSGLFAKDPTAALTQTTTIMSLPGANTGLDSLALVPAAELYFRKKNGTSEGSSPCVFLSEQGLCGVYEGRPLLCRLYHCASSSSAVETLFNSTFNTIEWLGRVVAGGSWQIQSSLAETALTLDFFLEQPLARLANPYALSQVKAELAAPAKK